MLPDNFEHHEAKRALARALLAALKDHNYAGHPSPDAGRPRQAIYRIRSLNLVLSLPTNYLPDMPEEATHQTCRRVLRGRTPKPRHRLNSSASSAPLGLNTILSSRRYSVLSKISRLGLAYSQEIPSQKGLQRPV